MNNIYMPFGEPGHDIKNCKKDEHGAISSDIEYGCDSCDEGVSGRRTEYVCGRLTDIGADRSTPGNRDHWHTDHCSNCVYVAYDKKVEAIIRHLIMIHFYENPESTDNMIEISVPGHPDTDKAVTNWFKFDRPLQLLRKARTCAQKNGIDCDFEELSQKCPSLSGIYLSNVFADKYFDSNRLMVEISDLKVAGNEVTYTLEHEDSWPGAIVDFAETCRCKYPYMSKYYDKIRFAAAAYLQLSTGCYSAVTQEKIRDAVEVVIMEYVTRHKGAKDLSGIKLALVAFDFYRSDIEKHYEELEAEYKQSFTFPEGLQYRFFRRIRGEEPKVKKGSDVMWV